MGVTMRIGTGRFVRQLRVCSQTSKKRLKDYTLVGLNYILLIVASRSYRSQVQYYDKKLKNMLTY